MLVHPHPNKHLLFRGNLQHGVNGELSQWSADGTARTATAAETAADSLKVPRRTLLINWWREAPMLPNCAPFEEARWRRMGLLRDARTLRSLLDRGDATRHGRDGGGRGGGRGGSNASASGSDASGDGGGVLTSSADALASWQLMEFVDGRTARFAVELPPTELYYFDFDEARQPGNWQLNWTAGRSLGPITRLDLMHQQSTSGLFRDVRPKLFLLLADGASRHWVGHLPKWLPALHAQFASRLRFVLVDPSTVRRCPHCAGPYTSWQ